MTSCLKHTTNAIDGYIMTFKQLSHSSEIFFVKYKISIPYTRYILQYNIV